MHSNLKETQHYPFGATLVERLDQYATLAKVCQRVEDAFRVRRGSGHHLVQNQARDERFASSAVGISHISTVMAPYANWMTLTLHSLGKR